MEDFFVDLFDCIFGQDSAMKRWIMVILGQKKTEDYHIGSIAFKKHNFNQEIKKNQNC